MGGLGGARLRGRECLLTQFSIISRQETRVNNRNRIIDVQRINWRCRTGKDYVFGNHSGKPTDAIEN